MSGSASASSAHLLGRLGIVQARVAAAVNRRRASDPDPDDGFRGLYITEAEVDELLAAGPGTPGIVLPDAESAVRLAELEAEADTAEAGGEELRLRRLARGFDLDALDVELLLVALAPDLDARFERLYGYLHDDVTRRRASTGLALELCHVSVGDGPGRTRFESSAALVAGGLVLVEEPDRPFLTRPLRVPDRVTFHLLGHDQPDPIISGLLSVVPDAATGDTAPLVRAIKAGTGLVYLRDQVGASGFGLAAQALAVTGRSAVAIDLSRLDSAAEVAGVAAIAAREARLQGAGLVAGPVEVLAERGPAAVRAWAEARCLVILTGARSWDPAWSRDVPCILSAPVPNAAERAGLWRAALNGGPSAVCDPALAVAQFRLGAHQISRAAKAACLQAVVEDRPLRDADLQLGARGQNAAGLERLARRVEARVGWDDLVLPAAVMAQVRALGDRARHRDLVLDSWGMGAKSSRGRGITALFAGDSGTGKTMSAQVVAGELGLDLYVIDLSSVVDKYVGETEKNLDRIFDEADRVNAVLLFDEADAIFGKRSEVRDAHDRYANVEVAYLLQRMELFDGVAILTTNLRANVDEAFTRRLDAIIDFPLPEEEDRRRLWDRHLRPTLPRSNDIDLDFLANAFKISGGNIRNVAVSAAYLAAAEARPIGMADLIRATHDEYQKLGHLCLEAEFGPYFRLVGLNGQSDLPEGADLGLAGAIATVQR